MKAFLALIAIVALAAADCDKVFKPAKRDCGWTVSILEKNDTSSYWKKTYYSVNGKFWAKKVIDFGDNILQYDINRPDIPYSDNIKASIFTSTDGQCKQLPGGSVDLTIVDYLVDTEIPFGSCTEGANFDGKKCNKYTTSITLPVIGTLDINVYAKDGEVIGMDGSAIRSWYLGKIDKLIIDWSSAAPMTRFAYNRLHAYKCPDDRIYKSGDDDYAFCAAYTTKAALAVVVSAIATALLALF